MGHRRHSGGGKGRRSSAAAASPFPFPIAGRALVDSASSSIEPERETRALAPFIVNAATLETLYGWGSWWELGPGEAAVLGLDSVWRCVTLIADAIAGRRWSEWRGDEELVPSRIVRRPAARITRRQWTWKVAASLVLYTRAPLWMVGGVDDEGVPGSLLPLPPDAVMPKGPVDPFGIREPARFTIGDVEVSAEELLIIRRAELPSIPPHQASLLLLARKLFGQAIASDTGATRYWESGGAPVAVLSSDQPLTTPQAEEIASRWQSRRAMGPDYPAVLGRGATAQPWGADPTRESAVEARAAIVAGVGRLFGVPPRLLNAPTSDPMTYATTEADSLDLIRFTLSGYRDPIADAISDLLPGDPILGRRCEIELDELTRAEQESRFRSWAIALGSKFMSVDEVRAQEHLGPMPESAATSPASGPAAAPAPPVVSVGADAAAARPGASEEVIA